DADETGDIGSGDVVSGRPEFLGSGSAAVVDIAHDLGQTCLGEVEVPGVAAGVLLHLQGAGGHSAGVRRLARGEQDACVGEDLHGFRGAGHVRAFGQSDETVLDQSGSRVSVEFVLSRAGQGDIDFGVPDVSALVVAGPPASLCDVLGDPPALFELDALDDLRVDPVRIVDVSGGVGHRDDRAAEGGDLLRGVDGDVSGSGDRHGASVDALLRRGEHVLEEVDHAETGRFGADHGAAVGQAPAGEGAGCGGVRPAPPLPEQAADLPAADADVAGGDVSVLSDMAGQFGHQRLAEAHDLAVAAALRVEVRASLAAADGQPGDRVLEDLLEPEELDDSEVDRGVEAQSALVGTQSRVELHTESAIDLDDAGIIDPGYAEDDLPLRFAQTLERREFQVFGVL